MRRIMAAPLAALAVLAATAGCAAAPPVPVPLRFATFNASLNRAEAGELVSDLSTPDDPQAAKVAEVIQRVRPDVLLINEFDHDPAAVDLFRSNYLQREHNGAGPIDYPYAFTAPSNTGEPSGVDLDNDGEVGGDNDAYGFGAFPGQYGMVVYSKHPIDTAAVRTFQKFLWKDLPGTRLPTGYYSPQAQAVLRLSSKSHWDLPVTVERADGARAGQPPHPAHVRRAGGPQRPAQRRRDRVLEASTSRRAVRRHWSTTPGRAGGLPPTPRS